MVCVQEAPWATAPLVQLSLLLLLSQALILFYLADSLQKYFKTFLPFLIAFSRRGFQDIYVTLSKLILLTAQQANKLGDEVLGQGITTLFRKPADGEDGRLMS